MIFRTLPVEEAHFLAGVAEEHGVPYEINLGQGHLESRLKRFATDPRGEISIGLTAEFWTLYDSVFREGP